MDFLDPKKKRSHQIRLYVGYALMAVALGIGTIIIAFATYGYGIDRRTGAVIQNGLITLETHPVSASIFVNGQYKGVTSTRLILPADDYTIQLTKDGYRDWRYSVNLEGNSIVQLVYPLLFPKQLVTKAINSYPTVPTFASESPDRHTLLLQNPAASGTFDAVDTTNSKNSLSSLGLPSDTMTAADGDHSFEAVEWASDNVHLLLKHIFSSGSEFIMLDRDHPENSLNLTKLFGAQPFTGISLRDKKPDQFYLHAAPGGALLTADSKTKAITVLLQHVNAYNAYQANSFVYATPSVKQPPVEEVHLWQDGQDYLVRTLPSATDYLVGLMQFAGHIYLAAGSPADGKVYVYKDPLSQLTHRPAGVPQPFRVLIVPGAQYLSFSPIYRFIAVQGGSSFGVFDVETVRQYRYDTKLPIASNEKAVWMDGHRLTLNSDGKANVLDFDGTNLQQLSASLPSIGPFFDKDYAAMFTLAPDATSPDKTVLLRTELKVLPAGQ